MRKQTPKLVITTHHFWQSNTFVLLLIVLCVVAGGYLYQYGYTRAPGDARSMQQALTGERKESKRLREDLKVVRQEKAMLEQTLQVDNVAHDQVRDSLEDLETEVLELKKRVAFYRSIVSPDDPSRGLQIETFEVEPSGQDRGYHYKLVLTQVLKKDKYASGIVDVRIEGMSGGERKTLTLEQLSTEQHKQLKFRFKYFQSIEGELVMPEGFTPQRTVVEVKHGDASVSETFDWPLD